MALLFFQFIVNSVVAGLVVFQIQQRKRIKDLELELERLGSASHAVLNSPAAGSVEVKIQEQAIVQNSTSINTPLGEVTSTLSEKQLVQGHKTREILGNAPDSYDKAQELLTKKVDIREVSRRTGLSLSELRLIGKVSQRNH